MLHSQWHVRGIKMEIDMKRVPHFIVLLGFLMLPAAVASGQNVQDHYVVRGKLTAYGGALRTMDAGRLLRLCEAVPADRFQALVSDVQEVVAELDAQVDRESIIEFTVVRAGGDVRCETQSWPPQSEENRLRLLTPDFKVEVSEDLPWAEDDRGWLNAQIDSRSTNGLELPWYECPTLDRLMPKTIKDLPADAERVDEVGQFITYRAERDNGSWREWTFERSGPRPRLFRERVQMVGPGAYLQATFFVDYGQLDVGGRGLARRVIRLSVANAKPEEVRNAMGWTIDRVATDDLPPTRTLPAAWGDVSPENWKRVSFEDKRPAPEGGRENFKVDRPLETVDELMAAFAEAQGVAAQRRVYGRTATGASPPATSSGNVSLWVGAGCILVMAVTVVLVSRHVRQ